MNLVDPQVYELAEAFVSDLLNEFTRPVSGTKRDLLIQRAAEAMQIAIEQECEAISEELADERRYEDAVDSGTAGGDSIVLERDR